MSEFNPFLLYNVVVGVFATIGLAYLLYIQRFVLSYRRFLYFLIVGFLLFSIGGPLADLFAPTWAHAVHGLAALFVIFALYDPVYNELRRDEWAALLLQEPKQIRHPQEWMTPMDEQILELFHTTELVLTPTIIAYNLDYSSKEVNRRLSELADHGLVQRVERGKYQLTELGERYLQGQLRSASANPGDSTVAQ